jgi:cytidylate kinase
MTRRVICISRSLGAGGEAIGLAASKEMGYRYVDDEIIVKAAAAAKITPEEMAQAEKPPGLIERLLESIGKTSADPEGWGSYATLAAEAATSSEALIELAVRETAREGNVVILAHGGSMALGQEENVLRVLITGSPDVRASRLQEAKDMGLPTARKEVDKSDKDRKAYLNRFYSIPEELPIHYDMVLNTDSLSMDTAVGLIVAATEA